MAIKSKNLSEKLTFSEKREVCARILREMHRMTPSFFAVTLIRQFLGVSQGYIGIYVSSEVLNGLEQGLSARMLIIKTLVMLGILFVVSLVSRYLDTYTSRIKEQVYDLLDGQMAIKSTQIDWPE